LIHTVDCDSLDIGRCPPCEEWTPPRHCVSDPKTTCTAGSEQSETFEFQSCAGSGGRHLYAIRIRLMIRRLSD